MKCVVRPFMSLMSTTENENLSDFVIVLPSVRFRKAPLIKIFWSYICFHKAGVSITLVISGH